MTQRYVLCLTGDGAAETAHVLVRRLVETGAGACPPDREPEDGFHGVWVCLSETLPDGVAGETVAVSPHDTPDFAAEKILDLLAGQGVVSLESEGYTPEEEEEIRQRLADLGYID